ncbi:MAG: hypothetical protein IIB60_04680 [Planctomycetes bacterium]|nr:hypothetical protein [Planctomycetota bacterium]
MNVARPNATKKRKAKKGRAKGKLKKIPAGNYDVCVTNTPNCGEGCLEMANIDVP